MKRIKLKRKSKNNMFVNTQQISHRRLHLQMPSDSIQLLVLVKTLQQTAINQQQCNQILCINLAAVHLINSSLHTP